MIWIVGFANWNILKKEIAFCRMKTTWNKDAVASDHQISPNWLQSFLIIQRCFDPGFINITLLLVIINLDIDILYLGILVEKPWRQSHDLRFSNDPIKWDRHFHKLFKTRIKSLFLLFILTHADAILHLSCSCFFFPHCTLHIRLCSNKKKNCRDKKLFF